VGVLIYFAIVAALILVVVLLVWRHRNLEALQSVLDARGLMPRMIDDPLLNRWWMIVAGDPQALGDTLGDDQMLRALLWSLRQKVHNAKSVRPDDAAELERLIPPTTRIPAVARAAGRSARPDQPGQPRAPRGSPRAARAR